MPPQPQDTDWPRVLLLLGCGVIVAAQVGKAPAALPVLRQALDLDLVLAGWLVSVFSLLAALAGSFAGIAGDRLGHRRLVAAGLAITALGSAAGALADGGGSLLASRFTEGVGFILVVAACPSLMLSLSAPCRRRLVLALWSTYMPVGIAAVMLLAPPFLADAGWRSLWLVNALVAAAVLALFLATTRGLRDSVAGAPADPRGWRRTVTAPGPLLLALCFGCYALQFMAVMGFLPTLLVERLGWDEGAASVATALVVLANVVGNVGASPLLGRGMGRGAVIGLGTLLVAVSAAGLYESDLPPALRLACAFLFSAAGGLLPGALLAGTPMHAPTPALVGTTNGLVMQGSQIGQLAGPPLVAAVVSTAGAWEGAAAVVALASVITAVAAGLLGERERAAAAGGRTRRATSPGGL